MVLNENAQQTVLPPQGAPTPGDMASVLVGWGLNAVKS